MDVPRLLAEILTWQGVPWHHQGRTRAGVDCVGLIVAALAAQGVAAQVPANYHTSAVGALLTHQLDASPLLARREQPDIEAGDLLAFRIKHPAQHLAVALGEGRMIHATRPAGVCAVTISPHWRDRLVAVYGWAGNHG